MKQKRSGWVDPRHLLSKEELAAAQAAFAAKVFVKPARIVGETFGEYHHIARPLEPTLSIEEARLRREERRLEEARAAAGLAGQGVKRSRPGNAEIRFNARGVSGAARGRGW